jgi:fibronectin type 3 domain-containing protein
MRVWFRVRKNLMLLLMGLLSTQLTACVGSASAAPAPAGVPAPPTGLTATSGNAQVNLTWTGSTDASSYHVKRAATSAGPFVLIGVPTTTSFLDSGLTNGATYFYAVSAVNSVGKSGNTPSASATPTGPAAERLAGPTGLTATSGNAQVSLRWTASAGATSYHVKRAATSFGPFALIGVPTTTSFLDTGLMNGTMYFYAVSAVTSVGKSGNSPAVSATPTGSAAVPATPTGLTATSGNAQIGLTWAASTGATSYHVKRATASGGPFAQIAVPATPSLNNTGLTNGTSYFYVVSAVNSVGESGNSSVASAKPTASAAAPTAPAGLTATSGNAQVSLTWVASTGATSYRVKRATTSGGPFAQIAVPATPSLNDTGLTNGTTYLYSVSAVNSVGESANSSVASAKPTASTKVPASITISPAQPSVAIGNKMQLSAIANYTDGSTQDVTSSSSWASSDPRKLRVSASGVAEGLASGTVAVSGDYNGHNASTDISISIGDIQWSGPIVITSGGTYSGNWESTNPNVNAVTVNTKDPVIIENSRVRGVANLISAGTAAGDLTVRNTVGLALNPNVAGLPNGLFVDASSPSRLVVENCYIENTRYGVRVSGYEGNRDGNQTIIIRYNRGRNMTGLDSDGHGGYAIITSTTSQGSNSYRKFSHFIQLKMIQAVPGIDIGWNEVIDEPFKSNIDDVINIYQTSGTPTSILAVHDSYIQGAYPYNPTIDHFSGGGITTDGTANDTPATASAYASFHDNQVVSTDNYGIGFASGHNLEAFNNRIISSGLLANGAQITLQNMGLAEVDAYGTNVANGSQYGNSMHDNTIGWMCWRSTCASNGLPEALTGYRREMYFPLNSNEYSRNFIMQENPITLAMEEGEYQTWLKKIQTNAITIGPTF